MKIKDIAIINPSAGSNKFEYINYIDTSSVKDGKLNKIQELKSNFPSRAKRKVKFGDILVSSVGPYLKHNYFVNIKKENLIASTGFIQIRVQESSYIPKFVYYFLTSNKNINYFDLIARSSATTIPTFNKNIIENLELPNIDCVDQQHIVDIIPILS